MLQAFVQNISSILDIYCKRFDLHVLHVSHICCRSMFIYFQSYVLASVFILQVAIVLFGCTTTQNVLRSISKMALEAGGPVARLGYSRQGSWTSNRLGKSLTEAGIVK
jgi:hypothetical protein